MSSTGGGPGLGRPKKLQAVEKEYAKKNKSVPSVATFFKPAPKPDKGGRPKKKKETRGRVRGGAKSKRASSSTLPPSSTTLPAAAPPSSGTTSPAVAETAVVTAPSASSSKSKRKDPPPPELEDTISKRKKVTINWSLPENAARLKKAADDWRNKTGEFLEAERKMSMRRYATLVGIPRPTLSREVKDGSAVNHTPGRPAFTLLTEFQQQFLVDLIRRQDRANDGLAVFEIIDKILELNPTLKGRQGWNLFTRTMRKNFSNELSNRVKAQLTTTKRTGINLPQQFRWHQYFDSELDFLRSVNTGLSACGKTFGELIDHFLLGGDETGMIANDGKAEIVGDKDRKKHEKKLADSRVSASMYRTGSAAGINGPTAFLPEGTRRKAEFTDEFLIEHGAAPGSCIVMTPSGYMTTEAWEKIAEAIAKGIRQMPVICDNPDWWCVMILDGFSAHLYSVEALEIYAKYKIRLGKEEGDTSHICQAYDKDVAKKDKSSIRSSLALLRSWTPVTKGVVSSWDLVHIGLAAVRSVKGETWGSSFHAVNLRPSTRVGFPAWAERIHQALQGGDSLKPEEERSYKTDYALLPSFWQGMEPDEKKSVLATYNKHGSWSVACVLDMQRAHHMETKDFQNLRVCLSLAEKEPKHLDLVGPPAESSAVSEHTAAGVEKVDINEGLTSFQLVPKDNNGKPKVTGEDLLDHMLRFLHTNTPLDEDVQVSLHMEVEVSADQQKYILNPTSEHYTARELASSAVGEGAKKNIAKRKMDVIGNVKSHCGTLNNPERIEELKKKNELAASIAYTNRMRDDQKKKKADDKAEKAREMAPDAAQKLRAAGGDAKKAKLTIKQMNSILVVCYLLDEAKGNKDAVRLVLENEYKKNPNALDAHVDPPVPNNNDGSSGSSSGGEGDDGGGDEQAPADLAADSNGESAAEEDFEEGSDDEEEDYREEWYGMRVAHRHVEDRNRICFGTVEDSGCPEWSTKMHWKVVFDEDDAAVHDEADGSILRDNEEDFKLEEMEVMMELYEDEKHNDPTPEKPSAK